MDLLVHDDVAGDQAANLALEEALARARPRSPLLRIWQNASCVVIGRAQRVSREVNLAACAAAGVPVLRRSSGGGTVYQDLGNLNISVAVPGRDSGLADSLAALVAAVIAGLGVPVFTNRRGVFGGTCRPPTAEERGVPAGTSRPPTAEERGVPAGTSRPPTAGGRGWLAGPAKVSGLATQVTRDGSLAHATLLVTTAADRVAAFLAPAPHDSHPADSRRSPVSSLRELGCDLSLDQARGAVLAEAAARYGPLSRRPLNDGELGWQQRLLAARYRNDSWHRYGRTEEAQWTTRPVLTCTG